LLKISLIILAILTGLGNIPEARGGPHLSVKPVRIDTNIDKDWKFRLLTPGDSPTWWMTGAEMPAYDDSEWKSVDIPHDWRISQEYNENNPPNNGFLPRGIAWYRKILKISPDYSGSKISIEFDGVFRNCTVWVNGKKAGSHLSGYTGFVLDITDLVDFNSAGNLLAVLVDDLHSDRGTGNRGGSEGWWYEGFGIYRHVKLVVTAPVYVSTWGTFVHTENVTEKSALVKVKTTISNETDKVQNIVVNTIFFSPKGKQIALLSGKLSIGAKSSSDIGQESNIANPDLWSPANPEIYKINTEILVNGVTADSYATPFGIRWFDFTSDKGFFLNGKHLQLRGMCIHHDFGGLGSALPDRAVYKTVEDAKNMGVNLIRSSHNDASPALMRACDELGMLLWAETRYLGSDDNAISSLTDLIRRARNHPSIICWSLANTAGSDDIRWTKALQAMNDCAKNEDPSRPTAFACEGNGDANKSGFALVTDIMGYNGGGMGIDDRDHELYPDRKMLISEFSSGRGARGIYKKEDVGTKTETLGDGRVVSRTSQLTSIYDLCLSHEKEWRHIAERPFLAGGFMWSGIEYVGETNGWPVVTSQFGVLDLCRFEKDAYYYYLQEWTNKPMVHIFPHWNWHKDDTVKVWSYSNCDNTELFLNGKSLGKKPKVPLGHIEWNVPFQEGVISARGYNNNKFAAEMQIKTAGVPEKLKASADRKIIKDDGNDLSFIKVTVCDKGGNMVSTADNIVKIEVTGGKLLGVCSGNPMAHDDPTSGKIKAFNGMLLAVVQSSEHNKKIVVSVKSQGLTDDMVIIDAR